MSNFSVFPHAMALSQIPIGLSQQFQKLFLQDLFITGLPYDTSAEQKKQSVFFLNDKKPGAEAPGNQAQLPVLGNRITLLAGPCTWPFRAAVFTVLNTSARSSAVALSIS